MKQKITIQNGISFKLNSDDSTACIGYSPRARGNIFIPKYISFQNQKYQITTIQERSFEHNYQIESIKFSDDSSLFSIQKKSFYNCSIKSLSIPSSVEQLEEGWCNFTVFLETVTISPNNPHFKYADEKHQIIIGKSDKNSEDFDRLVFASRLAQKAVIPPFIKHISSYAFDNCEKLRKIEITENSMLQSIGKKAFYETLIKEIKLPANFENLEAGWCAGALLLTTVSISPNNQNFKYLDEAHQIILGKSDKNSDDFDVLVFADRNVDKVIIPSYIKHISPYAFYNCEKLKKIEIPENSELQSIGRGSIGHKIEKLYIPSNVEIIDDKWCDQADSLKIVKLAPNNRNFKYLDEKHQIILGKSDKNLEDFDVLVFANRYIQEITIPPSIKHISSYAFCNCCHISEVKFHKDSQIRTIGHDAFAESSIFVITIPNSVEIIGKSAFQSCYNLNEVCIEKGSKLKSISNTLFDSCSLLTKVQIPENSELQSICTYSFYLTNIERLYIPSNVEVIEECWCRDTYNLTEVEISPSNRNFKYGDEEHHIILGKSDNNSEDFDVLVFACRKINEITIPPSVKRISPFSLCCNSLKKINFSEDSELLYIEESSIESKSIESIYIPSKVEILENNWINNAINLVNITVSPKNRNFKVLNQQILIGKSEINSEKFDVLIFASKNIKEAFIPSYIKIISSNAFSNCRALEKVEFQENSELELIKYHAFYESNIKSIIIPKNVKILESYSFSYCQQLQTVILEKGSKLKKIPADLFYLCPELKKVQIPEESSLQIIEENSFDHSGLNEIYIPSSVECLEANWCKNTTFLYKVTLSPNNKNYKFADDKNRIIIGKSDSDIDVYDSLVFVYQSCKTISIPKNVYKIDFSFNNCLKLRSLEYLGDTLLNSDFLEDCNALLIVSFPNLNEIIFDPNFRSCFLFYIAAGAKIIH